MTENQNNLDDLPVHLGRRLAAAGHDVEQRRGKRVEQALPDEHATEVVLRRRALQLEDAANAVQGVDDELALFGVVLVEEVHKDPQTAASKRVISTRLAIFAEERHTI